MKIVAISDQHGFLPEIPACDLLLIAGDICPATNHTADFQASWLDTNFRSWLNRIPARHVVGVFGNHDIIGMTHPHRVPKDLRWHYLECTSIEIEGLKIWGSPWQNWFYDWAFNAPKTNGEEWLATHIYSHMPLDADVVISHGPPHSLGNLDLTNPYMGRPAQNVGSTSFLSKLYEVKPKLMVTGHIHSGRTDEPFLTDWGGLFVNASIVNEKYNNVYAPVEFTISDEGGK